MPTRHRRLQHAAPLRPDRLRLGRHAVRQHDADRAAASRSPAATSASRCRAIATPPTSSAWACTTRCSTPCPGCRPSATPSSAARYRHHYLARQHELVLFPGTLEMLQALKSRRHAAGGGHRQGRRGLDEALAHSRLRRAVRRDPHRRRDRQQARPADAARADGASSASTAERTLMIGDTTHDLLLAVNAGTPRVAVSYGAHDARGLRRPRTAVRRASTARAARLAAGQRVTGMAHAGRRARGRRQRRRRREPLCAVRVADIDERGRAWVWDVLRVRPPGARLRAALRRPAARLHEPLRACADRDGLAARRIPRRRHAAGSCARCTAPATSRPTAAASAAPAAAAG